MALIAKMVCGKVEQQGGQGKQYAEVVTLSCVYDANPEHPNFKWSQATPSGGLNLNITNPDAFGVIKPGQEYMVTITKAKSGE